MIGFLVMFGALLVFSLLLCLVGLVVRMVSIVFVGAFCFLLVIAWSLGFRIDDKSLALLLILTIILGSIDVFVRIRRPK